MASRESVSLTFSADLAKLQSELAKIPGMTEKEAKLAVKELERQYKRAEVAAKKAADATAKAYTRQTSAAKKAADASALAADRIDDTSRSLDNMGRSAVHMDAVTSKAGEASSVMGGLAGALDTVDPKLGAVARGLGDAAGGLEAVGRGAGLSVAALLLVPPICTLRTSLSGQRRLRRPAPPPLLGHNGHSADSVRQSPRWVTNLQT